jgi:hypothetical protein
MYNVAIVDNDPVVFTGLENLPTVAIIDETDTANYDELIKTAKAIQIQVERHLKPYWNVSAVVKAYRSKNEVPSGAYIVYVRTRIVIDGKEQTGLKGVHQFANGLPYAIIKKWQYWSQTLSHEILEMLVNANLTYYVKSTYNGKVVYYLNEVAGATQAEEFYYTINGVRVTDFYTKNYFDLVWKPNTRYSFTGAILRPKDILNNGYASFLDDLGQWWQVFGINGSEKLVKFGENIGENAQNILIVALLLLVVIYFYQKENE